jgi:tRNA-dihydrouridine synthase B
MRDLLPADRPLLILAPMQDVTDLPFWRVMARYGGPDVYYTEYFRVHRDSRPEKYILRSIDENPTGRPVIAQMIGQDIDALRRTAGELQKRAIAGIDLNLGCPAPIVCKKDAGGGLLRHPEKIDAIIKNVREAVHLRFTVKTRVGFESHEEFPALLDIFRRHPIDALTVHGRTVREMYKPLLHVDAIARAARLMPCPVFANGNVRDLESARAQIAATGASGLMIGRGAIRNPWVFTQIREAWTTGVVTTRPTPADLRAYIDELDRETTHPGMTESGHVGKMKKYLGYIAPGVNGSDAFWNELKLTLKLNDLFAVCDKHLLGDAISHGTADAIWPCRQIGGF